MKQALLLSLLLITACDDDEDDIDDDDDGTSPTDETDPTDSQPVDDGPFDLTFTGTIEPHIGQVFHVIVIDNDDDSEVVKDSIIVPNDGMFSFMWEDILEDGGDYRIDYFADHNDNGQCDPTPDDHAWRYEIGTVSGDVVYDYQHDTNFTEVCDSFDGYFNDPRYDLTFTGSIPPHAGQLFGVRVVLVSDGSFAAADAITVPEGGAFSFTWPNLLVPGEEYRLDYWADFNENGVCDAPPTDHAWQYALGEASEDVTFDFQHDTNFTDVCASFADVD